jgi:hypothetical protein
MQFEVGGGGVSVTCVKCGVERDMPEGSGRMPARSNDPADGITVRTDTACRCGAERVRIKLSFE